MYIADNTDQTFKFNTLEDALVFVRECARYSPDVFYKVYEAKEIFNSGDFDIKSIREKEPVDSLVAGMPLYIKQIIQGAWIPKIKADNVLLLRKQ